MNGLAHGRISRRAEPPPRALRLEPPCSVPGQAVIRQSAGDLRPLRVRRPVLEPQTLGGRAQQDDVACDPVEGAVVRIDVPVDALPQLAAERFAEVHPDEEAQTPVVRADDRHGAVAVGHELGHGAALTRARELLAGVAVEEQEVALVPDDDVLASQRERGGGGRT